MIKRQNDGVHLFCTSCGKKVDKTFQNTLETYQYMQTNGWLHEIERGRWYEYCPTCLDNGEANTWKSEI
jgi:hypothetical protein